MALTPTQLGTKSKVTPGEAKAANRIARGLPLGQMAIGNNPLKQKFNPGQLVMMHNGLHRIIACEPTSFRYYMGVKCEVTAIGGANSITLKSTENGETGTDPGGFAASANDMILIGEQTWRQEYQLVKTASSSGLLNAVNGCVVTTSTTIDTGRFAVGDVATVLKLPAAAASDGGSGGAVVPDPIRFPALEAPGRDIVYHLSIGVSEHPKFISRTGAMVSVSSAGRISRQDTTITVGGSGTWPHQVTRSIGRKTSHTLTGLISGGLRVMQPPGVTRFAADETNHSRRGNTDSDRNHWGKSGVIESTNSPDHAPNPLFDIWTGVGEESVPEFQMINRHTEELYVPTITLVGWKYELKPVTEAETREMIRRSGTFRYEIIPIAFTNQNTSDGKSGPTNGWKGWVEENRGKRMSFEEYRRATEQTTEQTKNILLGTTGSTDTDLRQDPRQESRGY